MSRALLFYRWRVRARLWLRDYWPELVSIVLIAAALAVMGVEVMGGWR